jgi:hypothetical protein
LQLLQQQWQQTQPKRKKNLSQMVSLFSLLFFLVL